MERGAYLYSDVEVYVHLFGGDGKWFGGVDCYDLVCAHVVGRAGRHLEDIAMRHVCGSRVMT